MTTPPTELNSLKLSLSITLLLLHCIYFLLLLLIVSLFSLLWMILPWRISFLLGLLLFLFPSLLLFTMVVVIDPTCLSMKMIFVGVVAVELFVIPVSTKFYMNGVIADADSNSYGRWCCCYYFLLWLLSCWLRQGRETYWLLGMELFSLLLMGMILF